MKPLTDTKEAVEAAKGELTTTTIDSECYNQVLILLKLPFVKFSGELKTELIEAKDSLGPGEKVKLTIQGSAVILGRSLPTTITLTDRQGRQGAFRVCVVDVGTTDSPFGPSAPSYFEEKLGCNLHDGFLGTAVRNKEFLVKTFQARSDTLQLKISGELKAGEASETVEILKEPPVKLTPTGFALETFLFSDWTMPDVRFEVAGTFEFTPKNTAKVTVSIPVGKTGTPGLYSVTLSKSAINLSDVSALTGVHEDLFAEAPAELIDNFSFGLQRLTIDFYRQPASVGAIRAAISINKEWEILKGLKLSNVALHVEILQPLQPESRLIYFYVTGRLSLGTVTLDKVTLDAVASFAVGGRNGQISFSTLSKFPLSKLLGLPGGSVLESLDLPSAQVKLNELSIGFCLSAQEKQKLQSLRLDVLTELQWNLIPEVLSISNPRMFVDVTDPLNPPTRRVSARLEGIATLFGVGAQFEMERIEKRWKFAAQVDETVLLSSLVEKLGISKDLPADLQSLKVSGLATEFATGTAVEHSRFSLRGRVEDAKFEGFSLKSLSLQLTRAQTTSMTLSGSFQFRNAQLTVVFAYTGSWQIQIEALGLRGKYDNMTKTAQIELGDKKLGDIIRDIYSLVSPGTTARLPEPWNELEGISLAGTKFTIDFDQKRFGVTYKFDPECDLIFARLQEIGVNYVGGSVRMTVTARLLGKADYKNYDFNPRNPGSDLDPVPPIAAKPIDLRFLALGQRLALQTNQPQLEKQRVRDVLELMKTSFTGANPAGHPLTKPLKFDAQRGLLLGAEFSLFGTLSTKLVFNDGVVAGVSLGVSGDRARYFRGLDFEILYKKISEGLGVYQVELKVPDSIRQIELGAVSITIPQVALEIYTNGNFRVDLGFPKNSDFSRSFQLQVFPYLGSGGFYFAVLEGATVPRLPADRDQNLKSDRFRPALAFGLGLSIGIGKSINRGIFVAELSLSFVGILEGTLAFFKGEDQVPDSLYYWMQGTLGIVGRIRGRVSFSVITAEVSLVVRSSVGVTLESFQPLVLSFSAAVNIDLVVKIGTGWLSVDIYCSFAEEINEQITIPVRNPGIPAWAPRDGALAPKSQRALAPGGRSLLDDTLSTEGRAPRTQLLSDVPTSKGLVQVASRPIPSMTWNPIELSDEERDELRLLFRPQFTMAKVNDNEQIAQCVALLFLQSIDTASADNPQQEPPRSDFDRLAEAMLLWCIHSLLNEGRTVEIKSRMDLLKLPVSAEHLRGIYRVLTQKARGVAPFTGTQVADFLRRYFRVVIAGIPTDEQGDPVAAPTGLRPTVTIFPMIPELRVEASLTAQGTQGKYQLLHHAATFDEQTIVPLTYHDEILSHFERLASEFRAETEKAADLAAADPAPAELAPAGGRSIAEFVFEDYFLLIARDVVQRSLDLWSHVSGSNDSIASLCSRFNIPIGEFATDNANAAIRPGMELALGGGSTITAGDGDTLQSVADHFDVAVENLAALNKDTRGFLTSGQQLSLQDIGMLNVETLVKELPKEREPRPGDQLKPSSLAGMTSRFMLPGIRLPKPSYLVEDVRGLWLNGEPAPLYALTGQQFGLPRFDGTDGVFLRCNIALTLPERSDIASWYEFAGDEEATQVNIPMVKAPDGDVDQDGLGWIEKIRKSRLKPIAQTDKMEMSRVDPRRFALGNRATLETTQPLQFSLGQGQPSGTPTLWMLPEGLRQAISRRDLTPVFSLEVAVQTSDNSPALFREAAAYSWATALNVNIRKVVLPESAELKASPPIAYEIDGVDAEDLLLLEEILKKAGSNSDASFIEEIHILYRTQAPDGTTALTSDRPNSISTFILRTNLSTLTGPQSARGAAAGGESEPDVKLQMLRLLWQASSVRSGGYYLYYRTKERAATEAAFPDKIFDGKDVATITVLVTFDFGSKDVPSFVNRAVVGEATTANTKLFATSDPKQLFVRQPLLPPGHTGFVVRRRQPAWDPLDAQGRPQIDPPPQQQLEFLFSLLGCRVAVAENLSFKGSIEVPCDGPEGDEFISSFPISLRLPLWKYTKVIPFFKFSSSPLTSPVELQLPDPNRNPYRGIGKELKVQLDWFDGFGNKTPSPLIPVGAQLQPAKYFVDLLPGYTDELIGVERWPAVNAGYSVRKNTNGESEIYVQLDFDVSRYTPHGQGQRTVADAKKIAQADLEVFRKIYYQLTWGTTKVLLYTTIDTLTYALDSRAVIQFIGDIFKYLDSVCSRLYAFATDVGKIGESLDDIARRFVVSPEPLEYLAYLEDLRRLNPGVPSKLTEKTIIVLPNLTLPQRLVRSEVVSLSNPDAIFPLTATLEIERFDRIDDQFLDVPAVKSVAHELEPLPIAAGNGGGRASGAIRDFAQTFEEVFPATKLATGLSRPKDADSDSRNRLWVVQIGSEKDVGIKYEVRADQQYFFAPTPLATTLLTGTNPEGTESYVDIDLDELARRFLSALDTFFLPQYAVSAYIAAPGHYESIMKAKGEIAGFIADSVEGIAEGTGGDQKQARELLRQRMLVSLSAAYDVDTIVQIGVKVQSPFKKPDKTPETRPDYAPKFYGHPVAELPGVDDQPPEKLDFTLSTAKIPLVDGPSFLTFLFDSEKVEPEQMLALNLSYNATALEYDISDLPGVQDSKSPSWLTFIIPEVVIPDRPGMIPDRNPVQVKIPIPIRAHPIPPTVDKQGIGALELSKPNLKIEETRQYAYSYQYSRMRSGLDLVYTSPRFNSVKPGLEAKPSPAAAATGVSTGVAVTATFSEAMDAATISTSTFELRDPASVLVPAVVSYNARNRTATLTPNALLANSTTYTATVKGGSAGVKDAAGNALAADFTWKFTTTDASQGPLQAAQMDLFQALASFDRSWDDIRQDLLGALPELNNAGTPEEVTKTARTALKAFADLASLVATAWRTWNRNTAPVGPEIPGDREKYEQKQVPGVDDYLYVINEKRRSEVDDEWQITVCKCKGPADAPIPGIEIEGWQQEEIDTTGPNERRFQYLRYGEVMMEEAARANLTRTVAFNNPKKKKAALDILNKENAWPEIRMTRNETLFGDVACAEDGSPRTNPSFVYHTPRVRFAEVLKPRLEYGQEIDIAKLPKKPGANLDTPAQQPLKDHLALLFKRFFESVEPNPDDEEMVKRRIQLTCRYEYDLGNPSEHVDPLLIALPIVMAPPFDFAIPEGKNKTGSFLQSLIDAMNTWLEKRRPSGKDPRFIFDISLYSSIGTAKLPVYRVSNLQLRLDDIKEDPVEGG